MAASFDRSGGAGPKPGAFVLMLQLCTAYPQVAGNRSRSDRESRVIRPAWAPFVSVSQQSVASSAKRSNLDSTPMQFRLNLQRPGNSSGGVDERIQYADVEAKEAPNCDDEAEVAQTEIHRSFANEGAGPAGPRPCHFSAAAAGVTGHAQSRF